MLCGRCRRQLPRSAEPFCPKCGAERDADDRRGGRGALQLITPDGSGVVLTGTVSIGRARSNDLRLEDPSVSRQHAQIEVDGGTVMVSDVASSHGTYVDGARVADIHRLRAGEHLQLGDTTLLIDHAATGSGSGAHHIAAGTSLLLPAQGAPVMEHGSTIFGQLRPALKPGRAAVQVGDGPGSWWVIDTGEEEGSRIRLPDRFGELLGLLDGETPLPELIVEAERRLGPSGPATLARLLADLSERGLLEGVGMDDGTEPDDEALPAHLDRSDADDAKPTGWRRLITPRSWASERLGSAFTGLYEGGGWVLFTRPALILLAAIGIAGAAAWLALLFGRYGTPFVVASHLGLGGLAFVIARLVLVTAHELAHGLTVIWAGRAVPKVGLRVVLVFPYAYVDTSESWFEPRGRRLAVALSGPASDLVMGGLLALSCRFMPAGTLRDILFQAALAAYIGAFFNLNPFLDRDGYHALVDVLERPKLRERARAALSAAFAGVQRRDRDPAVWWYGTASIGWSLIGAAIGIGFSLRYAPLLEQYAPSAVVWGSLGIFWILLMVPAIATVAVPLFGRRTA